MRCSQQGAGVRYEEDEGALAWFDWFWSASSCGSRGDWAQKKVKNVPLCLDQTAKVCKSKDGKGERKEGVFWTWSQVDGCWIHRAQWEHSVTADPMSLGGSWDLGPGFLPERPKSWWFESDHEPMVLGREIKAIWLWQMLALFALTQRQNEHSWENRYEWRDQTWRRFEMFLSQLRRQSQTRLRQLTRRGFGTKKMIRMELEGQRSQLDTGKEKLSLHCWTELSLFLFLSLSQWQQFPRP